ncbi:MAG: hypothetical protein AAFY98_11970 [Verrucomicrobiota bacterium]
MQISRRRNQIECHLDVPEKFIFIKALRQLEADYRIHPEDAEEHLRSAWYSSKSQDEAGYSDDEFREWQSQLQEIRSERLENISHWLDRLAQGTSDLTRWEIADSEVDDLISILNDYRLLLALENDIGEHEMEENCFLMQDPDRRMVMIEIHVLAAFMECLIRAVEAE